MKSWFLTFQKLKLMIQNDVLVMITIYTNFLKGNSMEFFLWEPFKGRLVSVFELIKIFFMKTCFLPNVTTPTCFFSKFHKNEKSLQPNVHTMPRVQNMAAKGLKMIHFAHLGILFIYDWDLYCDCSTNYVFKFVI